jgi:hypothetical protein
MGSLTFEEFKKNLAAVDTNIQSHCNLVGILLFIIKFLINKIML